MDKKGIVIDGASAEIKDIDLLELILSDKYGVYHKRLGTMAIDIYANIDDREYVSAVSKDGKDEIRGKIFIFGSNRHRSTALTEEQCLRVLQHCVVSQVRGGGKRIILTDIERV